MMKCNGCGVGISPKHAVQRVTPPVPPQFPDWYCGWQCLKGAKDAKGTEKPQSQSLWQSSQTG